ncbi:MAG: GDP-mannose pyrophosphatase [Paraburkholderia fungorum]|jgi:nudix-type nucleoside diphosphatase (YffH/AdpP family)|uniref:GDP-mannose pyrophosphatase n=1 Tax=Paraburkholderia agricolaris TaxID=2152888 RepID=A0ABW8ZSG5_9BURK|nr:GDP-mannose pyrophosphatase [Paraburkholderia fungorum]
MSDRERIRVTARETLSNERRRLEKLTYEYDRSDGSTQLLTNEIYSVNDGAAGLLYDVARGTVVLVRQFRLPAYLQGSSGFTLEAAAGFLDGASPEDRVREEIMEEAGYRVSSVKKVCEALMVPGCVTHTVYGFVAPYTPEDKIAAGGGLLEEGEDISVVELSIDEALRMIESGEIVDGKTIILLQYAALHLFRSRQDVGS